MWRALGWIAILLVIGFPPPAAARSHYQFLDLSNAAYDTLTVADFDVDTDSAWGPKIAAFRILNNNTTAGTCSVVVVSNLPAIKDTLVIRLSAGLSTGAESFWWDLSCDSLFVKAPAATWMIVGTSDKGIR